VGDRTLRSGTYAVVDGVTYEAKRNSDSVSIFLHHAGDRPHGWGWAGAGTAYRTVDPDDVSELYRVTTEAQLDGVDVHVDEIDPVAREAVVRARHPEYSSIDDQDKPPPHPLLRAVQNPPYSVDWVARVSWDLLSHVTETVGKIDPVTGEGGYHNFT
jgi:hypothetical protein